MLWFQKSRMDAIRDGHRNTKYVHLSTIIRRRRNRIRSLQIAAGEWVFCQKETKQLVLGY